MLLVIAWVVKLGGASLRPVWQSDTTNDTSKLFNLHPLLQTAAFAVLMAEALQAWRSPIVPGLDRRVRGSTTALRSPAMHRRKCTGCMGLTNGLL